MIEHSKVIFVENPRTGTTTISDLLIEDGGFRVTPRHDPLRHPVGKLSFVVVRNPYTRMQSLYHYSKRLIEPYDDEYEPFLEWFERDDCFQQTPQLEWTANVDEVLKFENLFLRTFDFFNKLGIPCRVEAKVPTEYPPLSTKEKKAIQGRFKDDFKYFGY